MPHPGTWIALLVVTGALVVLFIRHLKATKRLRVLEGLVYGREQIADVLERTLGGQEQAPHPSKKRHLSVVRLDELPRVDSDSVWVPLPATAPYLVDADVDAIAEQLALRRQVEGIPHVLDWAVDARSRERVGDS